MVPEARQRLLTGDCLALIPALEAGSVDVVVTSPPYNLDLGYSAYQDRLPEQDYLDFLFAVSTALRRVLKPDGSIFLNVSGSSSRPWLPFELIVRLRPLFVLQNHIAWIKAIALPKDAVGHYKPVGGGRFLNHAHEHIFHLTLTGTVKLDRLAIGVPFKDKSNIARRGHARDAALSRQHLVHSVSDTVQQPGAEIPPPRHLSRSICRAGASGCTASPAPPVLDPFAGTGTTLVAAQPRGRHRHRHRAGPGISWPGGARSGWRRTPSDEASLLPPCWPRPTMPP